MSSKHRERIAQELVEQTRNHFRKQREEPPKKQPTLQGVEQSPEKRFDLDSNFHRVFSRIIGEEQSTINKTKDNEAKEKSPSSIPQSEVKEIEEPVKGGVGNHQYPRAASMPEKSEENTAGSAHVSVFEKLSMQTNKEVHNSQENAAEGAEKSNSDKAKDDVDPPVSFFEKLSRRSSVK